MLSLERLFEYKSDVSRWKWNAVNFKENFPFFVRKYFSGETFNNNISPET